MSLSKEEIIYELTRIKINLKIYQEHMANSSKDIDKLISYLNPAIKKRKRSEENANSLNSSKVEVRNNSSFESEVGDIVASLNCKGTKKFNTSKLTRSMSKEECPSTLDKTKTNINVNHSREGFQNLFAEKIDNNIQSSKNCYKVNLVEIKSDERIGTNQNITRREEREKSFEPVIHVLNETRSHENFQSNPIHNMNEFLKKVDNDIDSCGNTENNNNILARFNSAIKRIKKDTTSTISPPKDQEVTKERMIHAHTDNKTACGVNQSKSNFRQNIYYSPKDFFEEQSDLNKSICKFRLSTFGNLDLFYDQSKWIEVKNVDSTIKNKSDRRPYFVNISTLKLRLKSELEYKNMIGIAFELIQYQGNNFAGINSISQIINLKEVSADYLKNNLNSDKNFIFLVFENKSELLSYSKYSNSQWEDHFVKSLIEKKRKNYYPVFLKNRSIYQLSAEIRNVATNRVIEIKGEGDVKERSTDNTEWCADGINNIHNTGNKSIIKFGIERAPFPNNFTINNNTITNNISTTGSLCLNQNSKEISNIFRENISNNQDKHNNLWSNNNINLLRPNNNTNGICSSTGNFENKNNFNPTQSFGFSNNINNNWLSNINNNNINNPHINNRAPISIFNHSDNPNANPLCLNENFKNNHNFLNLNSALNNEEDLDNSMKWDINY